MKTPNLFTALVVHLAGPGVIWFVDADLETHVLGVEEYSKLTTDVVLRGHVFLAADSAQRFVAAAKRFN